MATKTRIATDDEATIADGAATADDGATTGDDATTADDSTNSDGVTDRPVTTIVRLGPFSNAELAAFSNEEVLASLEEAAQVRAALDGQIAQLGGEIERRQAFRERGATSLAAYLAGGCGFSAASARTFAKVGERLFDLPHLQHGLSSGELSLDQVRAVAGVAEPESDADWAEAARGLPVADLADLAERKAAEANAAGETPKRRVNTGPDRRSVRFNDGCCTMTARLPKIDYVAVRGVVEARVKALDSDGTTPLDERAGDALLTLLGNFESPLGRGAESSARAPSSAESTSLAGSPSSSGSRSSSVAQSAVVVAHIELKTLLDDGDGSLQLAELEGVGLVSAEVVRRLACDAALVIALDDVFGHTMYEGRARRFPTETQRRELWRRDRHCRFPGCSNDRFTRVHHVVPWKPDGRTDLDNLAILCDHHHHEVHSKRWSVSGDANVALSFVGPGGRVMTSVPSPLWGTVGAAARAEPGRKTPD